MDIIKTKKSSSWFNQLVPFLIITLAFILIIICMLPMRNLSFDDDFAYIQTAQRLSETGELKVSEWASSAVIFQTYWGALFTTILGFSIKALHISNLVLFYIALLCFYKTLRALNLDQIKSLSFTILLLSYPWVLQFAYSFMSDVFYMSLLIIAIYFYVEALKKNLLYFYLLGSLFASFAFLTRQIGVSIPIAIAIVLIYRSISEKKILIKPLILSLFPFICTMVAYYFWQSKVGVTAGHYATFVYPFNNDFLQYIWPKNLGHIGISNSLYIELLIQRVAAYINTTVVFLLPAFLLFKYRFSQLSIIKKNFLLIISFTLLISFIYGVDYWNKSKFSHSYPNVILMFDTFLDWRIWWNRFVLISLPIWILLCTYTFKKISESLLTKKQIKSKRRFLILPIIYLIFGIVIFIKMCSESYPNTLAYHYNPTNSNLPNDLVFTIKYILKSNDLLEATKDSWFFFLIITLLLAASWHLLVNYHIKFTKDINFSIFFVGIIFLIQAFFTVVLAHYYWDQYIIQFIPLLLVWIAYCLKRQPMNYIILPFILLLTLSFSLQITRNRYQEQGSKWEAATRLVESGIEPYQISDINWAWRPYWYFEKSFEEAVDKEGGDKYKTAIKDLGRWSKDLPYGDVYFSYEVPVDFKESHANNQEVVTISEPYWVFRQRIFPNYRRITITKVSLHE